MSAIRAQITDALVTTRPRSFEGLVAVLVKVDERIDHKRLAAIERFRPLIEDSTTRAQASGSELSDEEVAAVARTLLQCRYKKQQERLAQTRAAATHEPSI